MMSLIFRSDDVSFSVRSSIRLCDGTTCAYFQELASVVLILEGEVNQCAGEIGQLQVPDDISFANAKFPQLQAS